MKETLEKLWNEYLLDECAEIDTDEERKLTKKAFLRGCKFAVSFLLETINSEK